MAGRNSVRFVDNQGVRVAYSKAGGGPPILLFSHAGASSDGWDPAFIDALSKSLTVVRIDPRGTGRSSSSDQDYSLADIAGDGVAVLDSIGVLRVNVLGLSMGGAIAQEVALNYPDRVASLILVSTLAGWSHAIKREPWVDELLVASMDSRVPLRERVRGSLPAYYSRPFIERREEELVERGVGLIEETQPRSLSQQGHAISRFDSLDRLPLIRCPTLVIHGDADAMVPWPNGRALADRIRGARFELLSGVGHIPTTECPMEIADLVASFVLQQASYRGVQR